MATKKRSHIRARKQAALALTPEERATLQAEVAAFVFHAQQSLEWLCQTCEKMRQRLEADPDSPLHDLVDVDGLYRLLGGAEQASSGASSLAAIGTLPDPLRVLGELTEPALRAV